MSAKTWTVWLLGAALVAGLARPESVRAQDCATCAKECCPPWYKHYFERAPKLCFKKACPKPICDPCTLKNYGYYQTCWHPYPFAPDWSHCAAPPAGALVPPCCPHKSVVPPMKKEDKLPQGPGGTPLPMPSQGAKAAPPDWLPPPSATHTPETTSPVRYQEPTGAPRGPVLDPMLRPVPSTQERGWAPPPPPARGAPTFTPIRQTSLEEPAASEASAVTHAAVKEKQPEAVPPVPQPPRPLPPALVAPEASVPAPVAPPPAAPAQRPVSGAGVVPGVRMVNSQRIALDFNASELSAKQRQEIELWYTRDGRQWTRDSNARLEANSVVTEVKEEGTYGFSVVQRSGEGSGPKTGEQPQMWVEVDWNRPAVRLLEARFNRTANNRQILLTWTASDRNLANQPITLAYGTTPEGPWTTFAPSIPNTGRHVWNLPGNVNGPVYVRVEAFDLVGNVGGDHTVQPVPTSVLPGMTASQR